MAWWIKIDIELLSIRPCRTSLSEIWIKLKQFPVSAQKLYMKVSYTPLFRLRCVEGKYINVASFNKEVNPRLAKRPLKTNGRLANRELTSLVKEATVRRVVHEHGGFRYKSAVSSRKPPRNPQCCETYTDPGSVMLFWISRKVQERVYLFHQMCLIPNVLWDCNWQRRYS